MGDAEFTPLSALQHYLYCPRQCALIHVEQQWAENRQTAEGRLLHDRVDLPKTQRRPGVRCVTAMPLADAALGIGGIADVVEFHARADGAVETPFPVEYKRGRPKAHRADEVQLCAQALCLEAMLNVPVPAGALFYGQTRRRQDVTFDDALRQLTLQTIAAVRAMLGVGQTPSARYEARRCDACSLIDICQPHLLSRANGVQAWIARHLQESV
ncbi:CRISPR-associated protein Cas4 [Ottowia testudinis]|uniref:CRISPR-associated exonuclease Cas4 n=1 Tax=Ottowia testudinis TaxID=2816950 RepID=A0A975H687_9BURK|nr:CRISPR-associated protein Cas4 [Ottowia testudinis]QTD45752.1 CRISPR-associated protein Cas4 [Ottowia testudinis]